MAIEKPDDPTRVRSSGAIKWTDQSDVVMLSKTRCLFIAAAPILLVGENNCDDAGSSVQTASA
jgi:hypothetical protein